MGKSRLLSTSVSANQIPEFGSSQTQPCNKFGYFLLAGENGLLSFHTQKDLKTVSNTLQLLSVARWITIITLNQNFIYLPFPRTPPPPPPPHTHTHTPRSLNSNSLWIGRCIVLALAKVILPSFSKAYGGEGSPLTRWKISSCQNRTQLNLNNYLISFFYFTALSHLLYVSSGQEWFSSECRL